VEDHSAESPHSEVRRLNNELALAAIENSRAQKNIGLPRSNRCHTMGDQQEETLQQLLDLLPKDQRQVFEVGFGIQ